MSGVPSLPGPSRRSLLVGGSATLAVAGTGVVLAEGRQGTGDSARTLQGSFRSTAMRTDTRWSIGYPRGTRRGAPLAFLLVLHGRGDDSRDVLGSHRLGAFLDDAVRECRPYAVVGVDGGDHTYWHPRASGLDPQAMILDELLPVLAHQGLQVTRFAVGGWSMGGYGALLLAERLGPARIAALCLDSPAVWTRARDTAPGAFDSPQDFARHDVLAGAPRLAGIPVRVSCGTSDPFLPGVRALLQAVPGAERDLAPGGHDLAWWLRAAPAQLAFAGRHLATPA